MTPTTETFRLTNLAAGVDLSLSVATGADPLAAARAHLDESPLKPDEKQGCFISVYPSDPDAVEDDLVLG